MTELTTQLVDIARHVRTDYGWYVNRLMIVTTDDIAVIELIPVGKGGERKTEPKEFSGTIEQIVYTPPPHLYISLNRAILEREVIQCAYEMGAYDMRRETRDGYEEQEIEITIIGEPDINIRHGDHQLYQAVLAVPHKEYYFHPALIAAPDTRRWWFGQDRTLQHDGSRNGSAQLAVASHTHHIYVFTPRSARRRKFKA